jgi:hypothetical protein
MSKKVFYNINIIFSGCVIGTPVNFSMMIGRGLAVILKLKFWKSCDHKKSFITSESGRILMGHTDSCATKCLPRVIVESQKYCAISKEMVFYLEMYGYFAAIIASHDRKSINLRAQSMLKNHNKSPFYLRVYVVYRRVYILFCCCSSSSSWESAFSQLVSQ